MPLKRIAVGTDDMRGEFRDAPRSRRHKKSLVATPLSYLAYL